jgi:hypothetical protein
VSSSHISKRAPLSQRQHIDNIAEPELNLAQQCASPLIYNIDKVTPPSIEDRHSLDNNLSNPLLISSFCTASFITLIYLRKFIYTALNEIYDLHSPLRSVTITTYNHLINATVDCYQVISLTLESLHPCSYSSCEQIHRAQGTGTLQIVL